LAQSGAGRGEPRLGEVVRRGQRRALHQGRPPDRREVTISKTLTVKHAHPARRAMRGDPELADGREDRLYRWYEFFDAYMNTLISDDGRAIPILVTLGNHETVSGYWLRDERFPDHLEEYRQDDETRSILAPYFFKFFAMPGQPGYNVLDFGDYMSFILLDSDHANPVAGEQTEWLESTLIEREGIPHIFPIYHVTAYPSHRDFDHHRGIPGRIRENWVPLFEKYGVRIAFEKHDHTYKRTYPIRNNRIDPAGITYIGDGAWGVSTRSGNSRDEWYIKQFASERHAIITTIHGQHQHVLTVNENGEVIDEYPRTAHSFHYNMLHQNINQFINNTD
jgi:acid phosphatase type 7